MRLDARKVTVTPSARRRAAAGARRAARARNLVTRAPKFAKTLTNTSSNHATRPPCTRGRHDGENAHSVEAFCFRFPPRAFIETPRLLFLRRRAARATSGTEYAAVLPRSRRQHNLRRRKILVENTRRALSQGRKNVVVESCSLRELQQVVRRRGVQVTSRFLDGLEPIAVGNDLRSIGIGARPKARICAGTNSNCTYFGRQPRPSRTRGSAP